MNSGPIYINGRFLTQRVTGVQRFAREIVQALDRQLVKGGSYLADRAWTLLAPEGADRELDLKKIGFCKQGFGKGHFWEQTSLPRLTSKGILLNLANSGPFIHPRSLVVIHDAAVYRTPENFTFTYAFLHRVLGRLIARRSHIGTVSQFSRRELSEVLCLPHDSIFVVHNSCEHLSTHNVNTAILDELGVQAGKYFLCVGTAAPNKNIKRAMAAFGALASDELRLVLVGAGDAAVFSKATGPIPAGVIFAGRLSDAQVSALFKNAAALVFPSLYEGFGIPPLEAMLHGCPVLASHIPPVMEVCQDAAIYFDPLSEVSITRAMRSLLDHPTVSANIKARGSIRAAEFSWEESAAALIEAIATVDQSQ